MEVKEIKKLFRKTEKLYHYTSFETGLKIIKSGLLRYGRLSDMNDFFENDKLVYKIFNDDPRQNIEENYSALDLTYNEIYNYRQISFTAEEKKGDKKGFDLHQMWGLYAQKGEGVCLVFDKQTIVECLLASGEDCIFQRVSYIPQKHCDPSSYNSNSSSIDGIISEVKTNRELLFFHKRKEWKSEQEFRIIKRCPINRKEEYFDFGEALKFIIVSSKLKDTDDARYQENLLILTDLGKDIPILTYGNGFFNYSLNFLDGEGEIWNSDKGYNNSF